MERINDTPVIAGRASIASSRGATQIVAGASASRWPVYTGNATDGVWSIRCFGVCSGAVVRIAVVFGRDLVVGPTSHLIGLAWGPLLLR